MPSTMIPKSSVYCPPRKRFIAKYTGGAGGTGTGSKAGAGERVLARSKPFMPDPQRKRVHHYIRGLLLSPIYWPFTFLALLFPRHMGHHHHNDGFLRIYTYLVPVCFCPEVMFYILNFFHVPIIAYLLFTAWYCVGYREALLSLFREQVTEFRFCAAPPDELFTEGPIVGLETESQRLFVIACLITILSVLGVIGFYMGSKLLVAMWILMVFAIQMEYAVAYDNKFIADTNCRGSSYALTMCFIWNVKGHFYYKGMTEYEPPRVLANLQYSMECCGVQSYRDFYNFFVKQLPSSCCLTRWNKNLHCGWLTKRTFHKGYIHPTGCAEAWEKKCNTHVGLRTNGVRKVIFYHTILFIAGLILIIVYFGMLRTMAISAHHFSVILRNYVFPKIIKTREQRREEEELKMLSKTEARRGVRGLDGRVEPELLLRHHMDTEFIRNDNDDWNGFPDHYTPEVEALVEKLRRKHDLGNEDLGFEEDAPEGVAEENCMVNLEDLIKAKSRIVTTAQSLMSATRQKYLIAQSKIIDATLTPKSVKNELMDGPAVHPAKSTTIWKWEEKNRLNLSEIMEQVEKKEAANAARQKKIARHKLKKKQGKNWKADPYGHRSKSRASTVSMKSSELHNTESRQNQSRK